MNNEFERIAYNYIAPTLVNYTGWVISEAEKLGISHLYFLARDGYQMFHIADSKKCTVESSYFYCSRYSLRMAAYRFFDDTAYDKIFIPAFKLTAFNMLKRADFSSAERLSVYMDISYNEDENTVMGRKKFSEFCGKVKKSAVFKKIIEEKSDKAYSDVIDYIKQENMHRCEKIGIVDLGWTGSLQFTLRRLLDSIGTHAELHGFYMGMLDSPPESNNSMYHTWLFNEKDTGIKAWFSHNLMECICSAPHGMTKGYIRDNDRIIPVLAENENESYAAERIRQNSLEFLNNSSLDYSAEYRDNSLKNLRRIMFSPTKNEADALNVYQFCDDICEQYHRSIVQSGKRSEFLKEILPFKIFFTDNSDGLYWYYGTLASSSIRFKSVYKYGCYLTKRLLLSIRRR